MYDIYIKTSVNNKIGFLGLSVSLDTAQEKLKALYMDKNIALAVKNSDKKLFISSDKAKRVVLEQREFLLNSFPKIKKNESFNPKIVRDEVFWWSVFLASEELLKGGFHPGGYFIYVDKITEEIIIKSDNLILKIQEHYIDCDCEFSHKELFEKLKQEKVIKGCESLNNYGSNEYLKENVHFYIKKHSFPIGIKKMHGVFPNIHMGLKYVSISYDFVSYYENLFGMALLLIELKLGDFVWYSDQGDLQIVLIFKGGQLVLNENASIWEYINFKDRLKLDYTLKSISHPSIRSHR